MLRHPNLVAVDLSNFRCGHDAPVYAVVEEVLNASQTPYFTFHDIDENRPTGSIKIRVETIHYFLQRYEEEIKIIPLHDKIKDDEDCQAGCLTYP